MVMCQDNAATLDSLFSMYYVFNNIIFYYVKEHHQTLPKPDMVQVQILLTSDIPHYNLPGLNVKGLDK